MADSSGPSAAMSASPVDPGGGADAARASQGAGQADMQRLYETHARMVHAIIVARAGHSDAEDLVQEVFVQAMKKIGELRDGELVGPWLAAIARNKATDALRHRQRLRLVPIVDRAEPVARRRALRSEDVIRAIRSLPEAYRETLLMRLMEGLTGPEIADRLGMTHGSVRVNLTRGMKMLRAELSLEDAYETT